MVISNRLVEMCPGLQFHNEGEWSNTHSLYTAFNDAGVECEVGEFLYSMTRVLKPSRILETGTHYGIGAMYMAMGLMDNGGGMVDTFEFIPENYNKAMANFNKSDLRKFISAACMDVGTFIPSTQYDMIFLDTEPQTRFQELIRFFDYLKPGGFVFIHDLHQHMGQMENAEHGFAWPWGEMLPTITEWVQHNKLRPFHFKTPRGLTGFYKVDENDYKWGGK